jgi:hypothetical protein
MKKILILAILSLSLVACIEPSATPTEPTSTPVIAMPTITTEPTDTDVWPSMTPLPTVTKTVTPTDQPPTITPTDQPTAEPPNVTPTQIADPGNLFENPGFEWGWQSREEHTAYGVYLGVWPESWHPFSSAPPFVPELLQTLRPCAEGQTEDCNDPNTYQYLVEFSHTILLHGPNGTVYPKHPEDVYDGLVALQFYKSYGTFRAGTYQTINTTPGTTLKIGAYVKAVHNIDDNWESDLEKPSDWESATWRILINADGKSEYFLEENIVCAELKYEPPDRGFYDGFKEIECFYLVQSWQTTIFYLCERIWPVGNSNCYIDGAYAKLDN